jgi:TP901 family phage tail tape measure protein
MATTIYNFQADLTQLLRLNSELEKANATLLRLKANTAGYNATSKKLGQMQTALNKNTTALKKTNTQARMLNTQGNRMVAIFKSASIAIASAFAFRAIIGGIRGVITSFSDFESQMAAVKAISGATDEEFNKLKKSAEQLGRTTVFTATQVAQLQEEYARLGFTADEIVQAQAGTIDLAAATGESLKSSAETAGAVIRAFGLDARDTGTVVDVMGASFTSSALNLERFQQSMKFVAPVAKAAGFTLEETSAMLAQLADNGLHGSIAGNALKNIMLRLGDANSTLNKKLGKTVQGLPQFIEALRGMKEESFGLTEATELLDKRSAPAFLTLIGNIEGLEGSLDTLNNAEGAVTRMAAIRLDNLEGDFTLLKSATEGLGIAIGEMFNNSLRGSIDSLTLWIQALTNSKGAMFTIKLAFNTLVAILGMATLRLAALKAMTLSQTFSFKGMAKGVRLLAVSMRGLVTGTYSASTAMKGLKVAIASTGVGVLAIAIGTLIGYMMTLGEETDEAVMQMDRLHRSFDKDIESVMELNENDNERVNLLRKLKQEYPELIGFIDAEIASNKDLVAIQKLIKDTKTERGEIAAKRALIDLAFEQEEAETKSLRKRKLTIEAYIESTKNMNDEDRRRNITAVAQSKLRLLEIEAEIKEREKKTKGEEKALLKEIKLLQDLIAKKQQSNHVFRKLDTREEETYRKKLSDGYLKDLEDFRAIGKLSNTERAKMSQEEINRFLNKAKKKQLAEIDEAQAEKDSLDAQLKYAEIRSRLDSNRSSVRTQARRDLEAFKETQGGAIPQHIKEAEALNLVGIQVQELRKKLQKMDTALIKSGKASTKSAISVHRLNSTKDRIKELLKLQTDSIVEVNEREKMEIENNFQAKINKYKKELKLIDTNLKSIKSYQDGTASNQDKLNKKFIETNKNKYDVLKNLDAAGWARLNESTAEGILRRESMLVAMHQEETRRYNTNKDIQLALGDEKQRLIDIQSANNFQRNLDATSEFNDRKFEMEDEGALSIFRNNEERQRQLAEDSVTQTNIIKMKVKAGVMTEAEGKLAILENEKKFSEDMNKLQDDRLNKIKDVYSQIAGVIMDFSANRAEAESQRVTAEADKSIQVQEDKFSRELEIAEKAGLDTVGMQKKQDMKMRALEEQKAADLREIARKQFVLKKANDLVMATINGALAITKVTAQTGIGAIAAVPLTSALVAAQIGAIASRQFVGKFGGITPSNNNEGTLEKFASGGMVYGNSHERGGVKFKTGGRVVELEGGEAVINKKSTAMFRPQLSAMNSYNGYGKKFAQGGLTPGMRSTMDNAKGSWTANDIAGLISSSINSQQVFVTESDISSSQSVVNIIEGQSSIF